MKSLVAMVALGSALVLAGLGCGGGTRPPGHGSTSVPVLGRAAAARHRILLIGHGHGHARVFLWRPGSPVKPLGRIEEYAWGPNGPDGFFQAMHGAVWSPDGRSIAYEADSEPSLAPPTPEIFVMRSNGTHVKLLTGYADDSNVDENGALPSWSPDGRQIVYERSGEDCGCADMSVADFAIIDVPSGHKRSLPAAVDVTITSDPVWGKPGIAYFSLSGLMLLNPETGRSRLVTDGVADFSPLAWSPGGVLAVGEPTQVVLLQGSGQVLGKLRLPPGAGHVCGIAWSPNGKQILAATTNGADELAGLYVETLSTKEWQPLPAVPTWSNYTYDCGVSWR